MANANLSAAKAAKNDEFYTQLSEIRDELNNYTDKFQGKVVFCNCDDPAESNFVRYFLMNFNRLRLKELIATGYQTSPVRGKRVKLWSEPYAIRVTETKAYLVGTQTDLDTNCADYFLTAERNRISYPLYGNYAVDEKGERVQIDVKEEYVDDKTGKTKKRTVKHDLYYEAGDFRSDMCIELLQQADIVVTNPPFSLFREYVAQLMQYEKQFLIMGNKNAITYKEFFPLLKDNLVWPGVGSINGGRWMIIPDDVSLSSDKYKIDNDGHRVVNIAGVCWFTNLDHWKRHQMLPLDLGFTYEGHEDMYPMYDNYDAINVDKVSEIPCDYEPCWHNCPESHNCAYAQSEGRIDAAACEAGSRQQAAGSISAMELSGCQSHSLTNTVRNSSGLSDMNMMSPESAVAGSTLDSSRSPIMVNTSGFLFKKCNGVMGVPITFLDKYCPLQFEIVRFRHGDDGKDLCVNGKCPYFRILIRRK